MDRRLTDCTKGATRLLVCALLLLSLPAPVSADTKTDKIKAALCDQLVDVATWCHENGMHDVAATHVTEALGLSKNHVEAKALKSKLKPGSTATDDAKNKYDRTVWKRAAPKLAKQYLELFKRPHSANQQQAWDGYLVRAYLLAPSKARRTFEKTWKAAYKQKDYARVRRLLVAVKDVEEGARTMAARAAALEATAPGNVRLAKRLIELHTTPETLVGRRAIVRHHFVIVSSFVRTPVCRNASTPWKASSGRSSIS